MNVETVLGLTAAAMEQRGVGVGALVQPNPGEPCLPPSPLRARDDGRVPEGRGAVGAEDEPVAAARAQAVFEQVLWARDLRMDGSGGRAACAATVARIDLAQRPARRGRRRDGSSCSNDHGRRAHRGRRSEAARGGDLLRRMRSRDQSRRTEGGGRGRLCSWGCAAAMVALARDWTSRRSRMNSPGCARSSLLARAVPTTIARSPR
jgi:hypothetical protein